MGRVCGSVGGEKLVGMQVGMHRGYVGEHGTKAKKKQNS